LRGNGQLARPNADRFGMRGPDGRLLSACIAEPEIERESERAGPFSSPIRSSLILLRPKLSQLFLSAIHIGFSHGAELQQFLLTEYVCFTSFQFGALPFCRCGLRCFSQLL
jgi:hypothetical protein